MLFSSIIAFLLIGGHIESLSYRALVIVQHQPHKWSHFELHNKLAEILHSDGRHFEYVHFLVLTTNFEMFPQKLIESPDRRWVTQIESFLEPKNGQVRNAAAEGWVAPKWKNPWEERERFDPYSSAFKKWLGPLKNQILLDHLNGLHFNIGLVEVVNAAALAMFEMLPSIQWTVATSAVVPNLRLYENLAFFELRNLVPEVNHTEIGDHEIIGKNEQELEELAEKKAKIEDKLNWEEIKEKYISSFKARFEQMREKNLELLRIRAEQDDATWKLYKPIVEEYRRGYPKKGNADYSFPTLPEMFQKISYFFVNTQLGQNMPLVEHILTSQPEATSPKSIIIANKLRKKLRFFGGIGLAEQSTLNDKNDKNKIQTKAILEFDLPILAKIRADSPASAECFHQKNAGPHLPLKQPEIPKTVLVSFGTAIDSMPMPIRNALRDTFLGLEGDGLQFIWKARDHQKGASPEYTCDGNIFMNSWLPQAAILAHQNTALFISHCGANSVQESAHFNVPLICVPFKADQYYNAEGMASRGWASVLDIRQLPGTLKPKLVAAIRWHLDRNKPKMKMQNPHKMATEFLEAILQIGKNEH